MLWEAAPLSSLRPRRLPLPRTSGLTTRRYCVSLAIKLLRVETALRNPLKHHRKSLSPTASPGIHSRARSTRPYPTPVRPGQPPFPSDFTSRLPITAALPKHSGPPESRHCGAISITSTLHESVPRLGDKMSLPKSGINTRPAAPMRAYTPPPPDPDSSSTFLTDQIAKQQRSNFHSTSLHNVATMVSQSVNKTALHPKGVEYVLQHVVELPFHANTPPSGPKSSTPRLRPSSTTRHTLITTASPL
jgi:hypothetical protein